MKKPDEHFKEEEQMRRFFSQAGLPVGDANLHADRARWVQPEPQERTTRRRVSWLGASISLAGIVGVFFTQFHGGAASGSASSAAGSAAVSNGHRSSERTSLPSRVAVAVTMSYLKTHHQPVYPLLGITPHSSNASLPEAPLWQVSMANPQPDRQGIELPATRFVVNITTRRIVRVIYGPLNQVAADQMVRQWVQHHRPIGRNTQPKILSTQKVAALDPMGWIWYVNWRSHSGMVQKLQISPLTGWITVVKG